MRNNSFSSMDSREKKLYFFVLHSYLLLLFAQEFAQQRFVQDKYSPYAYCAIEHIFAWLISVWLALLARNRLIGTLRQSLDMLRFFKDRNPSLSLSLSLSLSRSGILIYTNLRIIFMNRVK